MYNEGEACWLNQLEIASQKFDNRVHGTTKMTPFGLSTNQNLIPNQIFTNNNIENKVPKFQVGDSVRVPDKLNIYSKGYTTNWNQSFFQNTQHKQYKSSNIYYRR